MRYMLLICHDPGFKEPTVKGESTAWLEEMEQRGVREHGDRLRPAAEAKIVRVRNDELSVGDGPFAKTTEEVGGYDIINCADLDEAIEIAAKHPVARFGTIEIRPVWRT